MLNAAISWKGNGGTPSTRQLFPVTAELFRRAQLPQAIDLETVDLIGLWAADDIPRQRVRDQLRDLLNQPQLPALTRNNIIVLCGYWLLWNETSAQGLVELRRLEQNIDRSDTRGWLNYLGLRSKAEAISGAFESAYQSLVQAEKLLNGRTQLTDLWLFSTRLNTVCNKAGFLQHSLAFARISLSFAKADNSVKQLANAKVDQAESLIANKVPDPGVKVLELAMLDSLAGVMWTAPLDLPLLPLFLANGKLQLNEHAAVPRLLSQSLDFESGTPTLYSDMQRELTRASLNIAVEQNKTAAKHLNTFTEMMMSAEHINLRMVDRSLNMLAEIRPSDRSPHSISLMEWQRSLRPDPLQWLPVLCKIQALLINLSEELPAGNRYS